MSGQQVLACDEVMDYLRLHPEWAQTYTVRMMHVLTGRNLAAVRNVTLVDAMGVLNNRVSVREQMGMRIVRTPYNVQIYGTTPGGVEYLRHVLWVENHDYKVDFGRSQGVRLRPVLTKRPVVDWEAGE